MAGSGEEIIITKASITGKPSKLPWVVSSSVAPSFEEKSCLVSFETNYDGEIDEQFLGKYICSLLFTNHPISKYLDQGKWKMNFSMINYNIFGSKGEVWLSYEVEVQGVVEWTLKIL